MSTSDTTCCLSSTYPHNADSVVSMNSEDFSKHLVMDDSDLTGERANEIFMEAARQLLLVPGGSLPHKVGGSAALATMLKDDNVAAADALLNALFLMNRAEMLGSLDDYEQGDPVLITVEESAVMKAFATVTECLGAMTTAATGRAF